ncbi:hypothetical protein PT974_07927 [Cladobotryum mycophilum]|uniref:Fe2OG dioxygenase domain-containing protein n=1 Tax=Cladobotryum mycophilum TaxID=491253 RepID=A0ABR0SCV7_9HYPO
MSSAYEEMQARLEEIRWPRGTLVPPSIIPIPALDEGSTTLLANVRSALVDRANKDVFAIGGKISVHPVTIRWNGRDDDWDRGRRVMLPVNQGDETSKMAFEQLVKDCQPATFGRGSEEVLDEGYRKAGKLDGAGFSTNFNPYEHGVIDAITQALIQTTHAKDNIWGVRAELYKLNVYSGPSGRFKSHVDTPRSDRQMGSLVVCFPHPHQGGQLAVRHAGKEVSFDWSSDASSAIHWAAFFSDCEHEVLEVTEGHRITLAYNLFWIPYGPASMADGLDVMDQQSLHFFEALKQFLTDPKFRAKGRKVGFTCTHAYPHTAQSSLEHLHLTLKGIDMVVFQALKRILGDARVTAVIDMQKYEESLEYGLRDFPKNAPEVLDQTSNTVFTKTLVAPVCYEGGNYEDGYPHPETVFKYTRVPIAKSGPRRRPYELREDYFFTTDNVTWLNHAPNEETAKELSIAYITYGNEPGIGSYYSSAVIMADLSPPEQPIAVPVLRSNN